MAFDQFALYTIRPSRQWATLQTNAGITSRALAQLTTLMREALYEGMQEAVIDTMRKSDLRSRRGKIFQNMMTGRRIRGSGRPSSIQGTFMFRPWMAIHETGGTIRPKKRYLALPMPAALRVDGRVKRRSPNSYRDKGTFVYTSKRTGKKFIVYRDKRTKTLVFLYFLATQVDMRKRMDLYGAIKAQEYYVVSAWAQGVMDIFNSVDLYGIAFQGLTVT